ncbi:MAG: cytochrome c biogenesis protein CcsA [Deltaproteobacteria bacterium]|nr:cytochrome c biogenesis protein CcsA [Deltaproteobacteria bacterium]
MGWGGYWAWDPVENASLLPWLTGTALVHSVMVQEKRKLLPVWNLTLAIVTFLLTLLGTFLTRSGVLDSVHSFTESAIGPWFLIFTGAVLAISVGLLLWRAPFFKPAGRQSGSSRFENLLSLEVLFLFNNLLFVSFCFVVFLGTWYPLVVEALQGKRISVGQPYFNQMSVPITCMILLVLGIGLLTPWRKGDPKKIRTSAKLPALLSAVVTLVAWILGARSPLIAGMIGLCGFAFFVMLLEVIRLSKTRSPLALLVDNPRRYGGFVSHLGALMVVIGVAFSAIYETDREITLKKGESAAVGNYELVFEEVVSRDTPQRYEVRARVDVTHNGKIKRVMTPQMNYYPNSREPVATPAIRSNLLRDIYLTLIQVEENGSRASLRVIIAPGVSWIWIGGFVVMLGGLLALSFGRKKV